MRSLLSARGRALGVCASALAAAALAGCGTTGTTTASIPGTTLTIYISKPAGALTNTQQDVISAEELALREIGSTVGKFTLKQDVLAGSPLSDNARTAIANPGTIAYLGELVPGSSAQTIGITNAQQVLQVSPTDGALELTQAVPEVPGSPGVYYESLSSNGQTFARVVPNDKFQAKALVDEMQSAGVKQLYIKDDGSDYGRVLRGLVTGDAPAAGISIASSLAGASGVFYAGTSTAAATELFNSAASSDPSIKLFAPSALDDNAFAATLSSGAQRDAYVSSPGFTTGSLPAAGHQFVAAFRAAYGHAPATQAIFGYQAMASVLAALRKAGGSANNHSTVMKDFLALSNENPGWPDSAVGSYSLDKSGDITYAGGAPFVFSHVKNGVLVPFKAVVG
jgi:ABC-type branched-subunit amino acid transport system substrate-binding protein